MVEYSHAKLESASTEKISIISSIAVVQLTSGQRTRTKGRIAGGGFLFFLSFT